MTESVAVAVIVLWDTKRFSTYDIAQALSIHEADVERVIHIRREAARGIVAGASS